MAQPNLAVCASVKATKYNKKQERKKPLPAPVLIQQNAYLHLLEYSTFFIHGNYLFVCSQHEKGKHAKDQRAQQERTHRHSGNFIDADKRNWPAAGNPSRSTRTKESKHIAA